MVADARFKLLDLADYKRPFSEELIAPRSRNRAPVIKPLIDVDAKDTKDFYGCKAEQQDGILGRGPRADACS